MFVVEAEVGMTDILEGSIDRVGTSVLVVRVPPAPKPPGYGYDLDVELLASPTSAPAVP